MTWEDERALENCDRGDHDLPSSATFSLNLRCRNCGDSEMDIAHARRDRSHARRRAGEKGDGSEFSYQVFARGDADIFSPGMEQDCRFGVARISSKILLQRYLTLAFTSGVRPDAASDVRHMVSYTPQILVGVLSGELACSYHLARAVGTALFEVESGFPGDGYRKLRPALGTLAGRAYVSPPAGYVDQANLWIDLFLDAATNGYLRTFLRDADRVNSTLS
jgi:hypothetical protein